MESIVNKVAESGLMSIDLEAMISDVEVEVFDMKDHLFMGMILKEKDFREAMKNIDLERYREKYAGINCSAEAVVPMWAYMLVASALEPVARRVFMGDKEQVIEKILLERIGGLDVKEYEGKRVVVKGCGDVEIRPSAYAEITRRLRPVVKSIMYGEPCSTVPVYKRK